MRVRGEVGGEGRGGGGGGGGRGGVGEGGRGSGEGVEFTFCKNCCSLTYLKCN